MEAAIPPIRTLRWWFIVYAAAITPIDVGRLGLIDPNGPDLIKWLLRLPVWFLPLIWVAPRWRGLLEALRRPPVSWLLAWVLLGMVSGWWALSVSQALLFGCAMAGLVILATWYVFTDGWQNFASAVVVGLTAIIAAGTLLDFLDPSELVEGRSVGLTPGPTNQGTIAALNLILAGGLIWSRRTSTFIWVAPVVSLAGLYLSETRTALAAAGVGLLYGGLRRLSRLYRGLVFGGLAVGALSAFLLVSAFSGVGELSERGDPTTVSGRTDIWPVAVGYIAEEPVLGYGWGGSEILFARAARDGDLTFLAGTSHSIVLSPLISGGIVGLSLFGLAVVSTFKHRRRVDPWIVAPVLAILLNGLAEAIINVPSISLFIMAGSMAAISRSPRRYATPQLQVATAGALE